MGASRLGVPSPIADSFLEFTACPGQALFPRVAHVLVPGAEPDDEEGSGTDEDDGIVREDDGQPLVEDDLSRGSHSSC